METPGIKHEMLSTYGNGQGGSDVQMEGIEPKYRRIYEIITVSFLMKLITVFSFKDDQLERGEHE